MEDTTGASCFIRRLKAFLRGVATFVLVPIVRHVPSVAQECGSKGRKNLTSGDPKNGSGDLIRTEKPHKFPFDHSKDRGRELLVTHRRRMNRVRDVVLDMFRGPDVGAVAIERINRHVCWNEI